VALDGILSSGLSAILTNTAALRLTSDNIANVNTAGYVRRDAQQQTLHPGGQLAGVSLGEIQRVVNNYLDKEVLDAGSNAARYDVQSTIMNQFNASLGQPGDGASLGSRIDAVYAALGQASLDPSSLSMRLGALNEFQTLAHSVSDLAGAVSSLRVSADQQIASSVSQVNLLIQKIYELNPQIQHSIIAGDPASGLLDQRDQLVNQLSQYIGVRTNLQSDGRLFLATSDGVQLISDAYAQLTSQPNAGPSFNPVVVQMINPVTGAAIGTPLNFDAHATSGKLRGLLDVRDNVLVGIGEELVTDAQTLSLAFNAQHNANAAVPPPSQLSGRQSGLLGTDALNFTGATNIGITDSNGSLVHKIAVDFDAGTLSVDGGPTSAVGGTVGSFVTALNTALGANGSADFTNGALTLSANGGNGLVVTDEASNPSDRAGAGFSHFFGLNDLFQAAGNAIVTTGLSSTDLHGLAPGGSITLLLKGPLGQRVNQVTVAVTGTTIGDMVGALNTAFAGNATFSLDANGQLQMTPAAAYQRYELEVPLDTTARGGTGESFTSLFGIGTGQALARAQSFNLNPDVADSAQRLAFAKPAFDQSTALGAMIVAPGDNRGLLALQDTINQARAFAQSGALPARRATLTDYAAAFYQDVSGRNTAIDSSKSAQDTRLKLAQQSQSHVEGVNLDEELEKMMVLQQAYNAGARLIKLAQDLYDELLNAVQR